MTNNKEKLERIFELDKLRTGLQSADLEAHNYKVLQQFHNIDCQLRNEAPLMAKMLREFKEDNDELMQECDIWRDQVQALNELDIEQTARIEKYEKALEKIELATQGRLETYKGKAITAREVEIQDFCLIHIKKIATQALEGKDDE